MPARSLLWSLPLAVLLLTSEARASDFTGLFVPVGANVGGSIRGDETGGGGLVLGGEASVVYFDGVWAGVYADALWDFGPSELRHSIGLEVGVGPLGLDFGYMGAVRDGDYRHGYVVRGMFSLAAISVYGRYGHVFDDARVASAAGDFAEVGVLLKVPIPASRSPRPVAPPSPGDAVAVPARAPAGAPVKAVAGDAPAVATDTAAP